MIAFLQPLVLLGLAAAAIPALLHLVGRRLPPRVLFPAVRYLTATHREHSRRLKLRNLLLLILRTAVIVFVVLAAARPVARVAGGSSHPPTAIALVVDNSLSAGAVVGGGRRMLDLLVERARLALARTTAEDRLWLVVADGLPRRVSRAEVAAALDSLTVWPVRLDLGDAVRAAARTIADDPSLGHEVVVFSDLQASAITGGSPPAVRVLLQAPPEPPENRAIDSAAAEPPVWSPTGAVVAAVGGSARHPGAVRLTLGGRPVARAVASPGDRVVLQAVAPSLGWMVGTVEVDPDELRGDDRRWVAVRVASPVAAHAGPGAGPFLTEALSVLQTAGRAAVGREVLLDDQLGERTTVLLPPADPSMVGALNRALATRGVGWEYGELLQGEWQLSGAIGPAAGAAVYRRYRLVGSGTVVARAGEEPWLVRSGNVVMVASRLEDDWTALPVGAAFVPFVNFVINRVAAEESWMVGTTPGAAVELPPSATAVAVPGGSIPVPSDGRVTAPLELGVYFLRGAGGDTVGALQVNPDARESDLAPADARSVRAALGNDALVLGDQAFERALFRGTRRADLTGFMIAAGVLAALIEMLVATAGTGAREVRDAPALG